MFHVEALYTSIISRLFPERPSPLVALPSELLQHIFHALGTNDLIRCGLLSKEMRTMAIQIICQDASLLSRVATKFFKHKSEEALHSFLETATQVVSKEKIPSYELQLDASRHWYASSSAMEALGALAPTLHKVTFTGKALPERPREYPLLPSCVRDLSIKDPNFHGLERVLKKVSSLRTLRISGTDNHILFRELFVMEYPESLQIFKVLLYNYQVERMTESSLGIKKYLQSGMKGQKPLSLLESLLEESVRLAPQLVSAKMKLALYVKTPERKRQLLQEVVKACPDHAEAHKELALLSSDDSGYHLARAREIAIRKRDLSMLSEIVYDMKDASLAMQAFRMIRWGKKVNCDTLSTIAETVDNWPDRVLTTSILSHVEQSGQEGQRLLKEITPWCKENRYWAGLSAIYRYTLSREVKAEILKLFCDTFGEDKKPLLASLKDKDVDTLCRLHHFFYERGIDIDVLLRATMYALSCVDSQDCVKQLSTYLSQWPDGALTQELFSFTHIDTFRFERIRSALFANKVLKYEQHVLKNMIRRDLEKGLDITKYWKLLEELEILPDELQKMLEVIISEDSDDSDSAREWLGRALYRGSHGLPQDTLRGKKLLRESVDCVLQSADAARCTSVLDTLVSLDLLPEAQKALRTKIPRPAPSSRARLTFI